MNFGRYKYEQSKREKEARKKQKVITVKEIRLRPAIDEHDYKVKLRSARRFLKNGDKVKVTVRFRGRQLVHADTGKELLTRMAEEKERGPTAAGPQKNTTVCATADHTYQALSSRRHIFEMIVPALAIF
jgi:translation initiation factor IF-3